VVSPKYKIGDEIISSLKITYIVDRVWGGNYILLCKMTNELYEQPIDAVNKFWKPANKEAQAILW